NAEEQGRGHERRRARYERRRHRDESPADHDARDPAACADALEDYVARDFEQAIPEEEQSGRDAVRRRAQPEIALQFFRDEPDVDAIEIRDDIADEGERNETPADARKDAPLVDGSAGGRRAQGRQNSRVFAA